MNQILHKKKHYESHCYLPGEWWIIGITDNSHFWVATLKDFGILLEGTLVIS